MCYLSFSFNLFNFSVLKARFTFHIFCKSVLIGMTKIMFCISPKHLHLGWYKKRKCVYKKESEVT